jgi:small subunit ribosomal protein S21
MEISVVEGNLEQAMRVMKKKMQKEGVYREIRLRKFYEKKSEKKRRRQAESIRRIRKKNKKLRAENGI